MVELARDREFSQQIVMSARFCKGSTHDDVQNDNVSLTHLKDHNLYGKSMVQQLMPAALMNPDSTSPSKFKSPKSCFAEYFLSEEHTVVTLSEQFRVTDKSDTINSNCQSCDGWEKKSMIQAKSKKRIWRSNKNLNKDI